LSESSWAPEVFFRYTITGSVISLWLILTMPSRFFLAIEKSATVSALLVGFLVLLIPLSGWGAYHVLYPCWRWILNHPLSSLRLYPRPLVHQALEELVGIVGLSISTRDLWSYFLWRYSEDPIRRRIKTLADAGHSLYVASFAFIVFPLIYLGIQNCLSYAALLDLFVDNMAHGLTAFPPLLAKFLLSLSSFAVGAVLMEEGHRRVDYAERIQWILLKDNEAQIQQLILALKTNAKQTKKQQGLANGGEAIPRLSDFLEHS